MCHPGLHRYMALFKFGHNDDLLVAEQIIFYKSHFHQALTIILINEWIAFEKLYLYISYKRKVFFSFF